MAVVAKLYGNSPVQAYGSGSAGNAPNIDWLSDDIRIMLCTSAYVPNQNTHVFKSDVTNEIAGTGYTAGGLALSSKTLSFGALVATFDAADAVWAAATFTARIAVIYDNTPASAGAKPLLGYIDFGADQSPSAGNFTIQFAAGGIFTITCS